MSGRILDRCVTRASVGVVVCMIATSGWGAAPPPDLATVPPNLDAVERAARQIMLSGCTTSPCQAMVSIGDVLRADLDASAATVGRSMPIPLGRDALKTRSLQQALLNHPERFEAVCYQAAGLMGRYGRPGSDPELFVPVSLILLGVDIDQRSTIHCVARLVAALPNTEAAVNVLNNSRKLCVLQHSSAACEAIDRP